MINTSEAFRSAVTADARRSLVKCVVDITDPDLVYGLLTSESKSLWSVDSEVHNKIFQSKAKYATLEHNRWLLNGQYDIFPDDYLVPQEMGYTSDKISDSNGEFQIPQYVRISFSGVSVLQGCSVYFSDHEEDGIPEDFEISVLEGGVARYTKNFVGNTSTFITLDGFTVYDPDAIEITVSKMNIGNRRLRILEIVVGIYEMWSGDDIAEISVTEQGNFSGLALPYGTCNLQINNISRRFEPRAKDGLFQSLEDRQSVDVFIGFATEDGEEYVPCGVYYQFQNGWSTGNNGISMSWQLVDIIGLLVDRDFQLTGNLPTTLAGWVSALVLQLGENFADRYLVDANYASMNCSVNSVEDVNGKTCGQILMWICQATGTWPRADAETGYLSVEPFWNEGVLITLDNIQNYPIMKSNDDIARIDITLSDGTEISYAGTSAASPKTVSIKNPFLHTQFAANSAVKNILSIYGGNQIETVGRGDPTSEIGDVATVELDESSATTGRVMFQNYSFSDGVLQNCKTTLMQSNGSYLYQTRELITASGTWTAPSGVSSLRVVIGQGGTGGGCGTNGVMGENGSASNPPRAGESGSIGSGGKIWYGTISINEQQTFAVTIGAGGAAATEHGEDGSSGAETTFGAYSSANGDYYENGYTDIANGDSYGRSGVPLPLNNSSDGGKGGAGGKAGVYHYEPVYDQDGNQIGRTRVIDSYPTEGEQGLAGGSGFVLIYYDMGDGN